LKSTMIQRREQGFVRACHGDMHLDNIAIIDDQPMLFDGIEFNESFRWIDTLSDLAFLLIDLDYRQQDVTFKSILSLYLSKTFDYKSLNLLVFYQVYRALVRAKITILRAQQLQSNSLQKRLTEEQAYRFIEQANRYSSIKRRPKTILLMGVSGSGKSTFSHALQTHFKTLNAITLSSDRIRKKHFDIHPLAKVTDNDKNTLYSKEMSELTYSSMIEFAHQVVDANFDVILDATFLSETRRQQAMNTLSKNSDVYIIALKVNLEFAEQSIINRQISGNNPSDATKEVMYEQIQQIEYPPESSTTLVIDTQTLHQQFPAEKLQDFLNLPLSY
jgi:predicted kinase